MYQVNTTQSRRRARLKREALALAGRLGYALAMGATLFALNRVGDGLRDALDTRRRGGGA